MANIGSSRAWRAVVSGQNCPFPKLARHGTVRWAALGRHAVNEADLNEALRQAGVDDIAAAKTVTLEPSGKITVLKAIRRARRNIDRLSLSATDNDRREKP